MKIVVTSDGKNVDKRFGRCKNFELYTIVDDKVTQHETKQNEGASEGHGAGLKAAEQVGKMGATVVITGQVGPNAQRLLDELGISVFKASGDCKSSVEEYIQGNLKPLFENTIVNETIFFPLLDNNGMDSKVSDHFGHAPYFGIYDKKESRLEIIENTIDHNDPQKSPIDMIEERFHPTTIFAKGIGARAINLIKEKNISLKTGEFSTVQEVIDNMSGLEEQHDSCGH